MADAGSQVYELQEVDLERDAPPIRGIPWYTDQSLPGVTPVRCSSVSDLSSTPTSRNPSAAPQKQEAQTALIFAVTGKRLHLGEHQHPTALTLSCHWYLAFLEFKILEAWNTLLAPVLANVNLKPTSPCDDDISAAFQFLTAVVSELSRKDIALVNIVDAMYNRCLLHETDDDRSKANQLVFAALGWITILYCPSSTPKPNCLQLYNEFDCDDGQRDDINERWNSINIARTSWSFVEHIDNNDQLDKPLFQLLRLFIPQCRRSRTTPQEPPSVMSGRHDQMIDTSLLCFHAVSVAGVTVQLVDSLSHHLDFDRRTKTLKLFRFPSLCILMYRDKDRSLLSQILQDCAVSITSFENEADYASEFFKEVLLSYRLLFGKNKRSRRAFSCWVARCETEWKSTPNTSRAPTDPILSILGSHSWESDEAQEIYDEVGADDPTDHYSSTLDFAFLGQRLLKLQNYVRSHSSRGLAGLLYGRRNVRWWWTFWAGGATLAFAVLQSVVQILQVVLAQQQLDQGRSGPETIR